jgi:hypothetical protein
MSCVPNPNHRFTITKGVENEFTFVIKGDGTTLPVAIEQSDSVIAVFKFLNTGEEFFRKNLVVEANTEGKVTLILTLEDVEVFQSRRGKEEDRYYLRPTYSLTLLCNTTAKGNFIAKVDYVYVD